MKLPFLFAGLLALGGQAFAQSCPGTSPPLNPRTTILPDGAVLLEWDAVPGSVGARLTVTPDAGPVRTDLLLGPEPDQRTVPSDRLRPGIYVWSVQAACATAPPYALTAPSVTDTFPVGIPPGCPSTVEDASGNVYPTALIGGQCWMAENLRTRHYRTGEPITLGDGVGFPWDMDNLGAYCTNPDADPDVFGLYYNYAAATKDKGICPAGWRLPTNADWDELGDALGPLAGGALKATDALSWTGPNNGATNSSGFNARGAGVRYEFGTSFRGFREQVVYWSLGEELPPRASGRALSTGSVRLNEARPRRRIGASIRCLKD